MKTNTFIILVLILWSVLFFAGGYKWRDHQPKQGFTCQFSGNEWTELTGFKDVKSAREYLDKDSTEENTRMRIDPYGGRIQGMTDEQYEHFQKTGELPKLKVISLGAKFPESVITHKTGNYYHFEDYKPIAFRPYRVEVKDEHSVILTTDNDTIVLYLENATNMAEEKLIYILPTKE